MGNDEYTWSKSEKEIARKIYDMAYHREMEKIKERIKTSISKYKEPKDIWKLHTYLTEKRKEIDYKYDYRYSVLLNVFGRLFEEGYISEEDLKGLSDEKVKRIKKLTELQRTL
jgi:hypothetical protein